MVRITVIPSVNEACVDDLIGKTAVVIDVLRATSTIITAIHQGCSGVVPVETVYQAKERKKGDELLGGERNGRQIPGFDLGNSPFEYMTEQVRDKTVIMTTTNGTRAIQKSAKASSVIAAGMINARSAARSALSLKRDIVIVCAGTKDKFSLEDGLCAGLVIAEIERLSGERAECDDFGMAMRLAYLHAEDRLEDEVKSCRNGKRLARIGLGEEVEYCAQRNITDVVPILQDHILTSHVLK